MSKAKTVPCEACRGTGARALPRVVSAAGAMIAHALDVLAGRHVGLARHQSTIRVLAHAERVRQLDPLDRIDVHGQVPLVHLAWPHPEQQRLVVRLHSLANPRSNAALAKLCDTLNALEVVYPGTNLKMVYEAPRVA